MRIFDLFLRRAGVDRAVALSRRRSTSRLTVEAPRANIGSLRRQICLDFQAAGLNVSQVEIDHGPSDVAQARITVNCPPTKRAELMAQARRLNDNPEVHCVRFGEVRRTQAI